MLRRQDVWLTAADGTRLHAWFMWPSEWDGQEGGPRAQLRRRPVVLFFQENAGLSLCLHAAPSYGVCQTQRYMQAQHRCPDGVVRLCRQHVLAAAVPYYACAKLELLCICT